VNECKPLAGGRRPTAADVLGMNAAAMSSIGPMVEPPLHSVGRCRLTLSNPH